MMRCFLLVWVETSVVSIVTVESGAKRQVVDFRVRPPFAGFLDTHLFRDRDRTAQIARRQLQEPPASLADASWQLFLDEFDESGVDLGVVPGRQAASPQGGLPNSDISRLVDESEGRLIGFGGVDQSADHPERMVEEAIVDLGLAGIALDPGFAFRPTLVADPVLNPIYSLAEELDVPVMITSSGNAGPHIGYADAISLDRLAANRPGLRIVVAHAGWPFVLDFLGVIFRRSNVWLSPDQYLIGLPGSDHWVEAANTFASGRILYGSSYPFMPLKGALAHYRSRPFDSAVLPRVLGGNAIDLLGLGLTS